MGSRHTDFVDTATTTMGSSHSNGVVIDRFCLPTSHSNGVVLKPLATMGSRHATAMGSRHAEAQQDAVRVDVASGTAPCFHWIDMSLSLPALSSGFIASCCAQCHLGTSGNSTSSVFIFLLPVELSHLPTIQVSFGCDGADGAFRDDQDDYAFF